MHIKKYRIALIIGVFIAVLMFVLSCSSIANDTKDDIYTVYDELKGIKNELEDIRLDISVTVDDGYSSGIDPLTTLRKTEDRIDSLLYSVDVALGKVDEIMADVYGISAVR